MKHYTLNRYAAKTLEKITCDICGNDVNEADTATLTKTHIEDDENCSDETYTTSFYYDFCGLCFRKKILKFLEILGAEPHRD